MNTAKNFQLLDDNNNNISPITNIESLYYEVNEGGVIYRNALYQHFPVYVKYNNNIDDPIDAGSLKAYIDNNIYKTTDSSFYKSPNVQLKEQFTPSTPGADILVTAIRQSRLANTRYHKLDISTYNLTSILNLYAPKQYVVDAVAALTEKTDHVKYKSNIAAKYNSGQFKTLYDIGSYPKGTSIGELNNKDINDIIDNAFFKEVAPNIINTSVNLLKQTPIYIEINPSNINKLHNIQEWKSLAYNTIKNFIKTNYKPSIPEFSLVYKLPGQNDTIPTNDYFNIKIDTNDQKLKDDILINGSSVTPDFYSAYLDIIPLKITTSSRWTDSNSTPYVKTNWGREVSKELSYNIIKNTPIKVTEPIYINNELVYKDKELYMTLPPITDLTTSYNNTVYLKQVVAKKYIGAYISYPRNTPEQTDIFNGNTMKKEVFNNLWNNGNSSSLKYFDINTDIDNNDVIIEHKCNNNILAIFIPNIKNFDKLKDSINITHIIHDGQKLPITPSNQFYKWTKIMNIDGVNDYKILILDTMLADINQFIVHINTTLIM